MGLLANKKIRTKLLLAVMPLTVMVLVATIYSSYETKAIDTWYSDPDTARCEDPAEHFDRAIPHHALRALSLRGDHGTGRG